MYRLLTLLIVCAFISCTQKPVFQDILTSNNLVAQSFEINPNKDTVIVGIRGGRISIPAGSFVVPAGQKVTVVIKEAYSARDMILAGLTTESNGRTLYSGGMIYIDATSAGKPVSIAKPINVGIPTDNYQNGMQLYEGELKADSTVNWIKAIPLDSFSMARGEWLFKSNCASCHKPKQDLTGPALYGSMERTPYPDWGYRFTTGAIRFDSKDAYLNELQRKWNNSVMTVFADMSRQDYYDIMKYIYAVGDKPKSIDIPNVAQSEATPATLGPISPCDTATLLVQTVYDTIYIDPSNYNLPITDDPSTPSTDDIKPIAVKRLKTSDLESLRQGFTDVGFGSGMYNFEIKTLGWFNVDAEVEGYAGTTIVKLNGKIYVEPKMNITLYLFCPSRKMLSVGSVNTNNEYSFTKIDGGIPLFNKDSCVLIAFGSYRSQLYLGSTSFTVGDKGKKDIYLKETDEKSFYKMLLTNNINGIDISCKKLEEKVVARPAYMPCNDSLGSKK